MRTVPENFNILVIEDNPADYYLIEQMLLSSKLPIKHIYTTGRMVEAVELLKEHEIGLVLQDLSLPDSFGIDSFLEIKHIAKKIPVIILTGLTDSEVALEALKQNAQDYLVKGEFNETLLIKSIEYSIERKKVEEKILASEEKYRQIFYTNPFPMWINDLNSLKILEVNNAAIQKYGYEREDFLKLTLNDIQQPPETTTHVPIAGVVQGKLWEHKKKNGDLMTVEFTYYPIDYFGRTAMQAQINDVTEKLKLENELTRKKQQMVEAVLSAQEKERKGIGEELHDNINQILLSVKLTLSVALDNPVKKDDLISSGITNISLAIEEIRKLSKTLIFSGNLKELGLVQSIEELIKDVLFVTKIHVDLDTNSLHEDIVSEEQKIAIYRIVQEQMNNILKYAEASSVTIRLHTTGTQVNLSIDDNGKGFDPGAKRHGIGITNIISRAELFNGKVKIDSSPGNGCRLNVVLNSKNFLPQEAA